MQVLDRLYRTQALIRSRFWRIPLRLFAQELSWHPRGVFTIHWYIVTHSVSRLALATEK